MKYLNVGTAAGREVCVGTLPGTGGSAAPQGYSIAAIVLCDGWKSDELGWLLNELYGGLDDWTEFVADAGARSFVFYGDRSEEASDLCDTFAYAWTNGAEKRYDDVVASSNDAADIENFVEAMFAGEVAVGDSYADRLQNMLFVALTGGVDEQADAALVQRLTGAVQASTKQHHFD